MIERLLAMGIGAVLTGIGIILLAAFIEWVRKKRRGKFLNDTLKERDSEIEILKKKVSYYEAPQDSQNGFDIETVKPVGIERRFSHYHSFDGRDYFNGAVTIFIMSDHSEFVLTTTLQDHTKYVERFNAFQEKK